MRCKRLSEPRPLSDVPSLFSWCCSAMLLAFDIKWISWKGATFRSSLIRAWFACSIRKTLSCKLVHSSTCF
uniref:Uncharacterized protein n=1 Tax=Anguilla anguilla TaxID=7936 RepID=A0A0E9WSC3_ANGAN